MQLVRFKDAGGDEFLVVPEHVVWLRSAGDLQTKIGFVGGDPIMIMGTPDEVGLKLQGRGS